MLFPATITLSSSKGLGGGPEITFPFKSNLPLWQAHKIIFVSGEYCTVQFK